MKTRNTEVVNEHQRVEEPTGDKVFIIPVSLQCFNLQNHVFSFRTALRQLACSRMRALGRQTTVASYFTGPVGGRCVNESPITAQDASII